MTLRPSRLAMPATSVRLIAPLLVALGGITFGATANASAEHVHRIAYRTAAASSTTSRHAEAVTYRPLTFAVVANLPPSADQVPRTQAFLQWIGTEGRAAFVLDLGNFKTQAEPCTDALFAARYALLNSSPVPLVYVPGQNDWADCGQSAGGATDPIERLDAVRDVFLSSPMSLGTSPLRLIRQSELPAFRPYRENTRWIQGGIVFASLNVPGDNNHFYEGGGRNGEYEDREIANRTWIARAVTDARRRHARGLVLFFEGDPRFPREVRTGLSSWLTRFSGNRRPDGFAALRRDLIAASHAFDGPVLVFYADHTTKTTRAARAARATRQSSTPVADSVAIESILHESNGDVVHRLKQIEVGMPLQLDRWLRVTMPASRANETSAASGRETTASRVKTPILEAPTFRFSMEKVPNDLPSLRLSSGKPAYPTGASAPEDGHAVPDGTDDVGGANKGNAGNAEGAGASGDDSPGLGELVEPTAGSDANSSALGNISTPVLLPLPPLGDTPPILRPSTARPPSGASPAAPSAPAVDAASASK